MKVLTKQHNGILYEFELLESARIIDVVKAGVPTYEMRWSTSLFVCNCPGSVYHRKCWHTSVIAELKAQPSITEPWAEWSEDAGKMRRTA